MEFKTNVTQKRGPIRLQFYRTPPAEIIELNEVELYAIDRIKALKCVETVRQDLVTGSREYDERLTAELSKLGSFGKSLTLPTSPKNCVDDIRRDVISHFILQVAFCRSEDLRRWFIHQEVELFRYRFLRERNNSANGPDVIADFLVKNQLHFIHLSHVERASIQSQLSAGTAAINFDINTAAFYKVYFAEVPELVKHRRVYVRRGFAYVPDSELVSLVVSRFRVQLSLHLARIGLTLTSRLGAAEENRLLPLLATLSQRYLGDDDYTSSAGAATSVVKAEQVDHLARQPGLFPPCMAQLHDALKTQHHLRHAGRMQYGLFLKGIGLPLDEALKFWRNSFAPKYDSDQFTKNYAYNIRHNYGKEGKRADYTPYSCVRIVTSSVPGSGEYHGCPFRHMDVDLLRQRLSSGGRLSTEAVDTIVKRSKDRLYHLACKEYFRGMLRLDHDSVAGLTIHHPNQFFDEAQRRLHESEDKETSGSMSRKGVTKVKMVAEHPSQQDANSSIVNATLMDEDEEGDAICADSMHMEDTVMT